MDSHHFIDKRFEKKERFQKNKITFILLIFSSIIFILSLLKLSLLEYSYIGIFIILFCVHLLVFQLFTYNQRKVSFIQWDPTNTSLSYTFRNSSSSKELQYSSIKNQLITKRNSQNLIIGFELILHSDGKKYRLMDSVFNLAELNLIYNAISKNCVAYDVQENEESHKQLQFHLN